MAQEEEIDLFDDLDSDESSILLDDFQEEGEFDEDLDESALGDLNYDEGEDFSLQPNQSEPAEKEKPKAAALPTESQKKRNKRYPEKILLLLLLLFGFAVWYFNDDFQETAFLDAYKPEPFVPEIEEEISPIVVPDLSEGAIPQPEALSLPEPEVFIVTEPEPPKPEDSPRIWMVQVAVCRFKTCVDSVSNRLHEMGYPVSQAASKRGYPLIKVISKQSYDITRYNELKNILANSSQEIFFSKRVPAGKKYRILLGHYTTLENAKRAREYVETRIFDGEVLFNMNKVYRASNQLKVLVGPYPSKKEGLAVVRDLRDFTEFNDAFLVRSKG